MIHNFLLAITEPFTLGKRLREKSPWLLPALLVLALTLIFALPYAPKQFRESMQMLQTLKPQVVERLKEAGRWEAMLNTPAKAIYLRTALGLSFSYFFSLLFTSLLVLLGLRFFSPEGNYTQILSLYSHISLINYPLATLLRDIIIYLKGTSVGVSTSLLLFFPLSPFSKAGRFLQAFDLFGLWAAIALGLALEGALNLRKRNALEVSVGVWLLKSLTVGGLSLLF